MPHTQTMAAPTLQNAYAYSAEWEIWYNGLIWQAIYNCISSFTQNETQSQVIPQVGPTMTVKVGVERFDYSVRVLRAMILKGWTDDPFEKEEKDAKDPFGVFTAILNLLNRKGHIRFKPPRDLSDE